MIRGNDMSRESLKDKKRIVFKVGTSTITHPETGALDFIKLEKIADEYEQKEIKNDCIAE